MRRREREDRISLLMTTSKGAPEAGRQGDAPVMRYVKVDMAAVLSELMQLLGEERGTEQATRVR